jgi:alpha-N-arabinofuranosidase
MQAYSLHFYTVRPDWGNKLRATGFGEPEWFDMLHECLQVDRAIRETKEVMDRVDARKRIALYVDEWGSWYRGETGRPGYELYQQNSLRDAILAGLTFHVLHEHNDRVRMANIAQVINVLQAMIFTDGPQMVLTPTYHLFEMYTVHHDAMRLPVKLSVPNYERDGRSMPALSVSASRKNDGTVHVSIVNAHARESAKLSCEIPGFNAPSVSGRVLTAERLDAHNTFAQPDSVKPAPFGGGTWEGGMLRTEIPPASVVVLELKK